MKVEKIKIKYKKEEKGDCLDDVIGIDTGVKCPMCGHILYFNQYYQSIYCDNQDHSVEISLKNFLNGVMKEIIKDNEKHPIIASKIQEQ